MVKHCTAFVAPGAVVLGEVTLGENVGIWYHATVRGDRAGIRIGAGSNIQDNCVVHVSHIQPVEIGEHVTVGHGAIVHGCSIGNNTLIGMGAILMDGCIVGENCMIGAGALITQNTIIPPNSLVLGNPGKVVRKVTPEEAAANMKNALFYVSEALERLKESDVTF